MTFSAKIKLFLIFTGNYFIVIHLFGQSFYLGSPTSYPKCKFSNDAIYFYGNSHLAKVDYSGNIIWSKTSSPFSRMIVDDASIYGINGNAVVKIDTAGNFIWARDFNLPIYNTNPNLTFIADIFSEGRRVYVSLTQNPSYPLPPLPQFSRAVVVLDTAGMLLSVVGDSICSWERVEIGCKSLVSGGWISLYDMDGIYHNCNVLHIDSTGNYFISSGGAGGTEVHVQDILPMADSSYLMILNLQQIGSANFLCQKISESGNCIWSSEYFDQYSQSSVFYAATDNLNNIYLLGYAWMSFNDSGPFLVKLDNMGNVILSKAWSQYSPQLQFVDQSSISVQNPVNGMTFHDGHLYCAGRYNIGIEQPSILVFDSLLGNPCFGPDSNIVISRGIINSWSGSAVQGMQPYSYLPSNTTRNLPFSANPNVNDLCNSLSATNMIHNTTCLFSPNPLITKSSLEYFKNESKNENCFIEIYNSMGILVRLTLLCFVDRKAQLDRENLVPGMYFYELTTENHEILGNGKFLVE